MNIAALVITLYLATFAIFGLYLNRKKGQLGLGDRGSSLGIFMIAAGAAGTRIGQLPMVWLEM